MTETMAADVAAHLQDIVKRFPGKPFAIVDGGHFDDFPAIFKKRRLFARSLFLATADVEVQKAGPWLVDLRQAPETIPTLLAIVGDRPALVLWSCDAGQSVLYHHLRTLNLVRIPRWAAEGLDDPEKPTEAADYETVFLRHYDPRTLGALLPGLSAAQFARILGPAEEVAFHAEDYGGVRRVVADARWPKPGGGLLSIDDVQVRGLLNARVAASHRRLAAYLRDVAPTETRAMDDASLLAHIRACETQAQAMRAHREDSIGMWAYLQLRSATDLSRDPKTVAFVTEPDSSANDQIERLFEEMTAQEEKASAWGEPALRCG